MTWEECRETLWSCREWLWKPNLELNLMEAWKARRKKSTGTSAAKGYCWMGQRIWCRTWKRPSSPLMVFNAFAIPGAEYQWENQDQGRLSLGGVGPGYGTLKQDIHKYMGPYGMYSQLLRELANVIARPLFIIFERSWQLGEALAD